MFRISVDTPAYYLTSVARDRLPVFRTAAIKALACSAIDEARRSGQFLVLAYVIMPDHLHLVLAGERKPSAMLRYVNGITSRRIISHLKEAGHTSSLEKLRRQDGARGHQYSLWDHHPNARILTSESALMQRVNYTHQNPMRLGMVERPDDYRWSSARQWRGTVVIEEPLLVDIGEIEWRKDR